MARTFKSAPLFLSALTCLLTAACQNRANPLTHANGNISHNSATTQRNAGKVAKAGVVDARDDLLDFSYRWPAAAAGVPALDKWMRADAARLRADAEKMASEDRAGSKASGFPYRQHSFLEHWSVAAGAPNLLVLQSDGYEFTGGAHGMPVLHALIWDKPGKRPLSPGALFDMPKLIAAAQDRFCKALDAARAKKRAGQAQHGKTSPVPEFVKCIDMRAQILLPVSQGGTALDTLRVLIPPYAAGPYVEGSYMIDLPFDQAMLAAVRPEWRAAFIAGNAAPES